MRPGSSLNVDSSGLPTVVVSGEIDLTNADEFTVAIEEAVRASGDIRLALDLDGVTGIDSSGVKALARLRAEAAGRGVELTIVRVGSQVLRMLQMSRMAEAVGLSAPIAEMEPRRVIGAIVPGWDIHESVALSDADMISPLRRVVLEAAIESGLTSEGIADVQIAAGEALANALRHGSTKEGSKIRVKCLSCSSAMVVEVTDEGAPFDFEGKVCEHPTPSPNGGMGIPIMCSAMDEVECQYTGTGNRVRMIKWLGSRDDGEEA